MEGGFFFWATDTRIINTWCSSFGDVVGSFGSGCMNWVRREVARGEGEDLPLKSGGGKLVGLSVCGYVGMDWEGMLTG